MSLYSWALAPWFIQKGRLVSVMWQEVHSSQLSVRLCVVRGGHPSPSAELSVHVFGKFQGVSATRSPLPDLEPCTDSNDAEQARPVKTVKALASIAKWSQGQTVGVHLECLTPTTSHDIAIDCVTGRSAHIWQ